VKHHRWVDLVRTTSFRLALLYALLFGVSAAVLLAVVYWAATGAMSGQLDAGLDAERAVLEDRYRTGGIGDLSAAITERLKNPAHPLSYLLQDPSGKILAGNLPSRPSLRVGSSELEVPPNEPAGNGDYEPRLFRTLGVSFADGSLLVLAQDAHPLDDLREFVMQSFGWGAAATRRSIVRVSGLWPAISAAGSRQQQEGARGVATSSIGWLLTSISYSIA
jgi:hypothetical protein